MHNSEYFDICQKERQITAGELSHTAGETDSWLLSSNKGAQKDMINFIKVLRRNVLTKSMYNKRIIFQEEILNKNFIGK